MRKSRDGIPQRQPFIVTFVDFSKAFDAVDTMKITESLRLPASFHDGMNASICCGDGCSDPFSVGHGVKQGCVLAPTLFTIFLATVLKSMPEELGDLYIQTKSDGDLFNLKRLKARNKTDAGTTDPGAALCG